MKRDAKEHGAIFLIQFGCLVWSIVDDQGTSSAVLISLLLCYSGWRFVKAVRP